MKTRIIIFAIIFVLFDIVYSNAFDENADRMHRLGKFCGREHNLQNPSGLKDMNPREYAALKFKKKGNKIQRDSFLIESVRVYKENSAGEKHTYTYNENKQILTYSCKLSYYNKQSINFYKYTHTYDENGNQLTYLYEGWKNDELVYAHKITYTYDENGNQITWLYEEWENDQQVNSSKNTSTYDENGNQITWLYEEWENDQWVKNDNWFQIKNYKKESYYHFFGYKGYKIEITWRNITSVGNEIDNNLSTIAFPNPFVNSTTIKYNLFEPSNVKIEIYNTLGNKITILVNEYKDVGEHQVIFNADNLPQGIYYYTIQIGKQIKSRKLLLVK